MRIGLFDSGVGGFSILDAVLRAFPGHDYVYFGDSANAPYGEKDANTVALLTAKGMEFLLGVEHCDFAITACNTATIHHKVEGKQVLGVVKSTAARAAQVAQQRIGILATPLTTSSGIYPHLIQAQRPEVEVVSIAAPLLVPIIEMGKEHTLEARQILRDYLSELGEVDTLVLGCTHYPLMREALELGCSPTTTLVQPGEAFVDTYRKRFEGPQGKGSVRFFTSGSVSQFQEHVLHWFPDLQGVTVASLSL